MPTRGRRRDEPAARGRLDQTPLHRASTWCGFGGTAANEGPKGCRKATVHSRPAGRSTNVFARTLGCPMIPSKRPNVLTRSSAPTRGWASVGNRATSCPLRKASKQRWRAVRAPLGIALCRASLSCYAAWISGCDTTTQASALPGAFRRRDGSRRVFLRFVHTDPTRTSVSRQLQLATDATLDDPSQW